jgi:Ca-activated chloride channel family protein
MRSFSNSRPFCACLLVSLCLSICFDFLPATEAAQESSEHPVIARAVDLVVLPVTVKDRNGQFVSGLTSKNFQVYEDGHPQEISLFRQEDTPVTVGLVVDHSASMAAKNSEVMAGAVAFVQASNAQDRDFVVNFSDTVSLGLPGGAEFTADVGQLQVAISARVISGRTALYDGLAAALEHFQAAPLDKKVIVLISDGGDNNSGRNFAQVLHMAQAANVVIYAIGLFDEQSTDQNPKVLQKLAKDTGGYAYFPGSYSEVVNTCKQIAADIRHQYTIGYMPADTERGDTEKFA